MVDVRFLENKFSNEIQYHIKKALPNLYDNFMYFRPATKYEDGNLSFDLAFDLNFTVSVRIRKFNYIKYFDLTIRSKSKNNGYTEVDKIKDGLAQIYFYAYMDSNETELIKVRIVNVDSIRKLIKDQKYEKRINNDNTEFLAFKFKDIHLENGAIYKFDKLTNINNITI
jgi:hypothetical protein